MNEYRWRNEHHPRLAQALERKYRGLTVEVKVRQLNDEQPFRVVGFSGPSNLLFEYGLANRNGEHVIDEFGTRTSGDPLGRKPYVYHLHSIDTGTEFGLHSRSQHYDNAKTRAVVARLLKRFAKVPA